MFTIQAPAKINLALDVLAKRPDGYHEVDMIMQTITLADQLSFELMPDSEIELTTNTRLVPDDQRNLIWKAVQLIRTETGCRGGVRIRLNKRIPVAAGLAGGSSDAAATLKALNFLWKLGLSLEQLLELGARLGADVPFCILQGTARCRGIGEQLTPIRRHARSTHRVLLVNPGIAVPTALIYKRLKLDQIQQHPTIDTAVAALEQDDLQNLESSWGNLLEAVTCNEFPVVRRVKKYFCDFGLIHNLMSGSGPSVFALNPPETIIRPFLQGLPSGWFGYLADFIDQSFDEKGDRNGTTTSSPDSVGQL
ncbi:MAG TPA: 4-(cytidine 5'-diphospho)-2-C-methyl-D-erythritol kinase [Bacillota bacterium]